LCTFISSPPFSRIPLSILFIIPSYFTPLLVPFPSTLRQNSLSKCRSNHTVTEVYWKNRQCYVL
jgi:hypothetical protein